MKYDQPVSNIAFNCNMRPSIKFTNVQEYRNLGVILDNVSDDMRRIVADAMYGRALQPLFLFVLNF